MTDAVVTILGAQGFIGSHLLDHFQQNGYQCFAPAKGDESIFARPLGRVIYAVGLTADFRSRPLDTVEAHVCLLRRLIQLGNFDSLTYLSSTRVYAGVTDTTETACLKVNPNDPGDLYNLSKLMGESLCLHGGNAKANVVRLSNIVGLRPDPDIFIDQLLDEGYGTGKVVFRTALESRKDYLYIDDAVNLIAHVAQAAEPGIYNAASGDGTDNEEIARALVASLGFEVSVLPNSPTWAFTAVDISKARTRFGFSPRKFSDYFPEFLRNYAQNRGVRLGNSRD
jgi:nucleoside-diphosphate-sugar epimerase